MLQSNRRANARIDRLHDRERTGRAIRRAAEIYRREYGAIRCREILHGSAPEAFQCGVKVKDAVLIVHKVLEETARETAPAGAREP